MSWKSVWQYRQIHYFTPSDIWGTNFQNNGIEVIKTGEMRNQLTEKGNRNERKIESEVMLQQRSQFFEMK